MIYDSATSGPQEGTKLTYEDAQARCTKINERAQLLTLRSKEENNYFNADGTHSKF